MTTTNPFRTTVAVLGAGPAGLLLARLLSQSGIDVVILESRSREYVEQRQRAGILEQGTIDILRQAGLGDYMAAEGLSHRGTIFVTQGQRHHVDLSALTGGREVMIYPQTKVCRDLIGVNLASDIPILFDAEVTSVEGVEENPRVVYKDADMSIRALDCDFVAACDGFWGPGRKAIPQSIVRTYEKTYPFSWLGIMADAKPPCDELVYARHERGFALLSMRSPTVSRHYIQVPNGTEADAWTEEEVWNELELRTETTDGLKVNRGQITAKSVTPMRSWVHEPMQFGKLFLAGDAAHIVPPTGAKGLNLAVGDVAVLASAFKEFFATGSTAKLEAYSSTCLRRIWQAERFSTDMTTMFHVNPEASPFDDRVSQARLYRMATNSAAQADFAAGYTGFPLQV